MTDEPRIDPRKRPRQARSKAMVEKLLDATATVLVDEGYVGLTTNRIAEVAEVSVGSLYQYFPNKDALVIELFRGLVDSQMELLAKRLAELQLDNTATVREAAEILVRTVFDARDIDPQLHRVLFTSVTTTAQVDLVGTWLRRIVDMITIGMTDHAEEIRREDPRLASYIAVGAVHGVIAAAMLDDTRQYDAETLANETTDLVIRYLCP